MGPVPYAFSVHHFINSVGADAGFAAIIGLAILVLLYFAQARETSSLREQSYESAQRVQQLEARVAQLARQQPAPARPPAVVPPPPATRPPAASAAAGTAAAGAASHGVAFPGGAASPEPDLTFAAVPGAPAGVGAPALTAATKLIPEASAAAGVGTGGESAGTGGAGTGVTGGVGTAERPGAQQPATPGPATAAGGANGTSQPVAVPARVEPMPPPIQIRPTGSGTGARRAAIGGGTSRAGSPSRGRRVLTGLLVVVLAAAVVGGLLLLTSGGTSTNNNTNTSSASNSNAPTPHRHRSAFAVSPSTVTVSVLNGTATNGLAGRISQKLNGSGFKPGAVRTAIDQTRTATTVSYLAGHRQDALAVATALKLGPASVAPVDANTQAVACPPPATCTSDVVVTVGADLANTP